MLPWSKKRASRREHDDTPPSGLRPRASLRGRAATRLRAFDDWRQVFTLRVIVPLILAAVSAYYLTRWAHANAMPWGLAWTLPAALDVTAYKAVTVAKHPINKAAKLKASALAWLCVALSAAGNIGSHALEVKPPEGGTPLLVVNMWTIAATSMVYPLMLIAGHIVAGGMKPRPRTAAELERERAAEATARAERLEAEAIAKAAARKRPAAPPAAAPAPAQARPAAAPAPAPAAPAPAPARPTAAPAPARPTAAPAPAAVRAPVPAVDTRTDAELIDQAVEFLRKNPGGRRVLVGEEGIGITDHKAKTIHAAAMARLEAEQASSAA
jgi:hypothetical protein